jgi:hypothetical protein
MPAAAWRDDAVVAMIPVRQAAPGEAVAKGRISYDISADGLLLHTIQTEDAFDALLASGVLVPDSRGGCRCCHPQRRLPWNHARAHGR